MNTAKHEATPSALSAAIEGIIRRSDEITAACEGVRGELAALFTPKEISRSIDICKALITAVARTRNSRARVSAINDTAPSQDPRIYRLRTLLAVAAVSAFLGLAIARLLLFLRSLLRRHSGKPRPLRGDDLRALFKR